MRHYYKECKTVKGINGYLKSIGLGDYVGIDKEIMDNYRVSVEYFDWDGWVNSEKTEGISACFYKNNDSFEVFASKYTAKDITSMNAEIDK